MSSNQRFPHIALRFVMLAVVMLLLCAMGLAQSTVSTGSIVGTVTDPSGAVLSGAKVTVTNTATGQTIDLTSNSAGAFNSGALSPARYKVQVSAKGFSSISTIANVQVGNTSTVNAKMQLGQESTTIEVQASTVQVNTEQAIVQGVLNSQQIENLPVNGRNFLDLAQLEPGVQIQDGQNFDPTKAGYSSISFGGRFGRTARINVDGVDVSDETVGTTTANIPASAIDEFQLSQSSLDLSQDLTSSGAVNVTIKSGTNAFHGEGFYFVRDHSFAALSPGGNDNYFQRHQYGGKLGGPVIKNKLFFFADGERTKQDSAAGVQFGDPFTAVSGTFTQPFRENNLLGKVDYDLGNGAKAFYRFSYFENALPSDFGLGFSVYSNVDKTRQHVAGVDWAQGTFSHSIRFSFLKFQNQIVDTVLGSSLPFAQYETTITTVAGGFYAGPSPLAPQSTPQSNHQIKYDGSKVVHTHTLRYGFAFNHIQGGGFASFYGTAPRVRFRLTPGTEAFAATGSWVPGCPDAQASGMCFDGGSSNPLNYPVYRVYVGNGQGFNTLDPALGFPAGGLGPDNRIGAYVGDSWKIKPNFTLSVGLRYDRDTGRTDSDLPAIASVNAQFPGLGNRVKQANLNFAPQVGFAWDPKNNGKTVIRGGAGLFYENVIFNNVLFDRPYRLATGAFNQVNLACSGGVPQPVPVSQNFDPSGFTTPGAGVCSVDPAGKVPIPIGQAIPNVLNFWHNNVLAGNPFDLKAANPNFIDNYMAAGFGIPLGWFDPNYKTPRSVQLNIGIQREVRHGMVFSADYLRNIETRSLLGVDVNHVGAAKNFDATAAANIIGITNAGFTHNGVNCGTLAGGAGVDCAIAAGASIVDYAGNGLTTDQDFGEACIQAIGYNCAFHGNNPAQGQAFALKPIGRSVYNALQMKLSQNVANPLKGVKAANFQVAYSFSNFSNTGGLQVTGTPGDSDQDFVLQSADNSSPGRYYGPALLDRTHQISFGGYVDVPLNFRIGVIGHFYSPLSSAIVAQTSGNPGEIFLTDYTGDGTYGDPLPKTQFGQFGRDTSASGLTKLIDNYNASVAGTPTPAGQALIASSLISAPQLTSLGGVSPQFSDPVPGQMNFGWLKTADLKLAWRYAVKERVTFEPSVGFYNLFNTPNFNLPPNTMNGILSGSSGSINGTDKLQNEQFRVGNGTGVYSLGSARQIEFGVRMTF